MRNREAGTRAGIVVALVAAGIAIAGVAVLGLGLSRLSDASTTRDEATRVRHDGRVAVAKAHQIERGSDSPITKADTVASSVSDIVDASDTVVEQSDTTSDLLGRAVDLANDGNLSAARNLYGGEAATSVQASQAELAKAQAALAAAQQAVADLVGPPK